jgi:hypothetical protein
MGIMTTGDWTDYYSTETAGIRPALQTYTSQPSGTNGLDTYIQSGTPTTNFGGGVTIVVGKKSSDSYTTRSLIKFSALPTDVVSLISAQLVLTVSSDLSTNARDFKVYRCLRDWVESEATWNIYSAGNNWATAGGQSGVDYDSTVLATVSMSASESAGTQKTFNLDVTEVMKIINGTYNNYGFFIKADTESSDAYSFDSSDGATPAYRPKLILTYYNV